MTLPTSRSARNPVLNAPGRDPGSGDSSITGFSRTRKRVTHRGPPRALAGRPTPATLRSSFRPFDLEDPMDQRASALSFAARPPVLLKYFGQLCLAVSAAASVPLGVALLVGEFPVAARYGVVVAGLAATGYALNRLRVTAKIQGNEAMVLSALIFLFTPLVMTYPMMASGIGFVDALFEAVSAGTTTGLSTLATVEDKPTSFLFARAWMQWYGGLGIVVLSLALLVRPGLAAKRLAAAESEDDDLVGGTRAHARRVLVVYCLLTAAGILCLWPAAGSLFEAVTNTLSAVSTGGFSPHDASLAAYGRSSVAWITTLLCLAGAVPLALYRPGSRRDRTAIFTDPQSASLFAACCAGTILVGFCLVRAGRPWSEVLWHGPLMALSAQTTAGFSTLAPAELDAASKFALIVSMAVGGGLGSTAGGVKVLRLLVFLRLLHTVVVRTCMPRHAVLAPRLGGQRLEDLTINDALLVMLLFGAAVVASWFPFLLMGYDPLDALFEVVSATGTVGLSVGITRPDLPVVLKGVLCADMLLGRVELVAWMVILYPRTWWGRRAKSR